LCSLLESWGGRGDRTAIVAFRNGKAEDWSYGRIAFSARGFGLGLLARGVAPREPVMICARNSPEWVVSYFGILLAGALPVPVNDLASKRELAHIVAASGARRIVTTARHAPDFRGLGAELQFILLDDAGEEGWSRLLGALERPLPAARAEDPASLLWTSGTTGVPKGVPLTHRNFIANLDALLTENIAEARDRILLPLPLHHAYPFTVGLLLAFAVGATLLFPAGMTGPEITAATRSGGATAIVGVPRLYAALFDAISAGAAARGRVAAVLFNSLLAVSIAARRRLGLRLGRLLFSRVHAAVGPKLRILASGGARLDPELGSRLQGLGYEVMTGYGLTETAPILTMSPRGRCRIGAEGTAAPGVDIEIVPEPGRPYGEILAKGPNVFAGYWKNEAATRAAFAAQGWFRTGDLGFLDADGYLHVTGRKSEMIVLPGGENVFPEEVEAVYGESPAIREIAVLEHGGKLVALVVPDESFFRARGAARIEALLREELENAGTRLASYRRISGFAAVQEALPRTHLGKLKRHLLLPLYARAKAPVPAAETKPPSEADRALLAEPLAAAIHHWLAQRYPSKRVTLDSVPQLDLGIDSLEWVTLTFELQESFGIALTEEALSRIVTLRDLIAEALAAKSATAPSPRAAPAAAIEIPETSRWLGPQGPLLRALGAVLYYGNRVLMRAAFRLRVVGAEHVPAAGSLVLAPNHASLLDPFLVAAALPLARLRHCYWAGRTGRLFWNPVLRVFSRIARVVPVDPERAPAEGLSFGLAVLARGEALVWFPEGRLSPTGEVGPFLRGVGYLLARSRANVVPVRITGSFAAMPHGWRWPRRVDVTVSFGKPTAPAILEAMGTGPDLFARIADGLRAAVLALAPGP
jgi:long-chain acyl-CoA synthetase